MKNITIRNFFILVLFVSINVEAQIPYPAGAQQKPVMVSGGTIHVGNGKIIENGVLTFEGGKLMYVGVASAAPADKTKYEAVDATGKQIYPGLIMLNSQLGLVEISSIRATNDTNEHSD